MDILTTSVSCGCCCSTDHKPLPGRYVTPWCAMLNKCARGNQVVNFFYKIEDVRKEIEKRSSYLGKLRRTEESKHLLDLIAMTADEEDLFTPFAKAAMADVFDVLQLYAHDCSCAYLWNEGVDNTVVVPDFDDTAAAETDNSEEEEPTVYQFWAGDWVIWRDTVYVALQDGTAEDAEDMENNILNEVIMANTDWRYSIHYMLEFPAKCSNMMSPLDTAIFEALVARILFKWLEYSYPSEAARYLAEYKENKESIRKRAGDVWGNKIVRRIPRMF